MIFIANCLSQSFITKKLTWDNIEVFSNLKFSNKEDVIIWGKSNNIYASVKQSEYKHKDCIYFILQIDICSGISCPNIYVFRKDEDLWTLIGKTQIKLTEKLIIFLDTENERFVFKTNNLDLGEFSLK